MPTRCTGWLVSESIRVEIVYALPEKQEIVRVDLSSGATVRDAIEASGVLQKHPEIDVAKNRFGIFAKLAKLEAVLRDRDRVEVYRPLIADPKEVRKQRAAEGRIMKRGAGE